ncbi:Pentatricopeptide repeat-containing protein, partial [Durusdinium trenchii]
MKLFIQTLKDSIAAELPVKTSELFFQAFYSPNVWRKNNETMQQYIVRREQDFRRLEENATGTSVPEQIRAMMLLCFGGLDPKEQTSILSSCNNTYEFQKIARAMRIQYPNSAGKPVIRRDYLGARSSGQPLQSQHFRAKWRGRLDHKTRQVLAVEDEPDFTPADEDAYYEDDEEYQIADDEEAFQGYSDDELMDALLSEFPDFEEDPHVAEAFATVAQHRFNKKKKFGGRPTPSSSPTTSAGQQLGFTAKGEMSFSEKARDQRRTAVKFLKSVTPCTVCHQKGHWAGDAECPASRKGKGKGKGKPSAKKKPQKVATTLFVSRGHEPEDNLAEETALCAEAEPQECYISESITAPEDNDPAQNSYDPAGFFVPVIESLPDTSYGMFLLAHYTMNSKKVAEVSRVKIDYGNQPVKRRSKVAFSHVCDESEEDEGESLMTLHCPKLCEHSSYTGGSERKYHRGANGHTRHVTCKESECNKTVIVGHRKEAVELWSYFIQILMCTKWGQEARSAGLFRRVGQVRDEYDQEVRRDKALTMAPSAPAAASIARRTTRKTAGPIPDSPYDDGWSLCDGASGGYPSPSSPSSNEASPTEEEIRAFEKEVLVDYDYPRDYGGQNPDDVHDHEDWIASLREDVKELLRMAGDISKDSETEDDEAIDDVLTGQLNFESGWQWGYWLANSAQALVAWRRVTDTKDAFQHLLHFLGKKTAEDLADLLGEYASEQKRLLIRGVRQGGVQTIPAPGTGLGSATGIAYLQGSEGLSDFASLLSRYMGEGAPAPDRLQLMELYSEKPPMTLRVLRALLQGTSKVDDHELHRQRLQWFQEHLHPLLTETNATFHTLAKRFEQFRSAESQVIEDLAASARMLSLRASQVLALYEY